MRKKKIIFTIGHSTHSTREFIGMLKAFEIEVLVDVRHYPGSRYCPQFGKVRLRNNLRRHDINYVHLEALGGRRKPAKDAHLNDGWRNPQFRGYADYMQTKEFKQALKDLVAIAKEKNVAIMCSEAVPWRCHRSLLGDALLVKKFEVIDIFSLKISREHKLTSFAHVEGQTVTYP